MPNSATRAADKRERLVESAKSLFYEQGVHPTTLAEVAARAEVPLGNVYYYFKTKEQLTAAVVDSRTAEARQTLASFDQKRTPQARLKALARGWVEIAETVTRYGCPLGSLCTELGKNPDGLEGEVGAPFVLVVDWAEQQLRQLGRRDARDLAFSLLARIQGAALLAQTFRDPQILAREARQIDRWIDGLG
jgi:TetR/AcrR family transcriptional repressor of nem operon